MFPILIHLGSLNVYAYGFFIAIGFIWGFLLALRRAREEGIPLEKMVDLLLCVILSAIIGSRGLYVMVNLDLYRDDPLQVLRVWEGGLVFYGGLVLAIVVSYGYLKGKQVSPWKVADLVSPSIALGLFFGRIGCFLAGCCYGKEANLPWAVTFTDADSLARLNISLHPTQLYEAIGSLSVFFFLNAKRRNKTFDGQVFWLFILLYAVIRFFLEYLRDDPRGVLFGATLSTSQEIGFCLAILSLFMLFYLRKKKRREGSWLSSKS